MIPVANYLPYKPSRRKVKRFHPVECLKGLIIGASFVAGFVAAAHWLARK